MKKIIFIILSILFLYLFFEGCSVQQTDIEETSKEISESANPSNGRINETIMGNGNSTPQQLAEYFLTYNPDYDKKFLNWFTEAYIEEAKIEGVNWDIAFCQMSLETNFLKYGGQVKSSQNNFAGIGALDGGARGATFEDVRTGIRAHIQHLKAYASHDDLNNPLVDPRFKYVQRGSANKITDLGNGKWASDPNYSDKILRNMRNLHSTKPV